MRVRVRACFHYIFIISNFFQKVSVQSNNRVLLELIYEVVLLIRERNGKVSEAHGKCFLLLEHYFLKT